MNLSPYLNFDGNTEEAMTFYAKALGGELEPIHRFGTMPSEQPLPPELANRVMHVTLRLPGGMRIMASDTMPGMGPDRVAGNAHSISLHPTSKEQADAIFAALSEGATIGMPLEDQFWGDYYGHLTDKFGMQWMVNYNSNDV